MLSEFFDFLTFSEFLCKKTATKNSNNSLTINVNSILTFYLIFSLSFFGIIKI